VSGILNDVLLRLGGAAADLLSVAKGDPEAGRKMVAFADAYLKSAQGRRYVFF
jgi:hypothetical protein